MKDIDCFIEKKKKSTIFENLDEFEPNKNQNSFWNEDGFEAFKINISKTTQANLNCGFACSDTMQDFKPLKQLSEYPTIHMKSFKV